MTEKIHKSVMPTEVLEGLHVKTDGKYVDATLGAGGHTIEILRLGGKVLGIDADESMIALAEAEIVIACPDLKSKFQVFHGNFRNIKEAVKETAFGPVDGVLFDLGISSKHLDSDQRGFSFKDPNSHLDMRLDTHAQSITAAQLLNILREDQLIELFTQGMSFPVARRWAASVVRKRALRPFEVVRDILEIAPPTTSKIHPATQAFMALRMAVNSEIENLTAGLEDAFDVLAREGRLVAITFHSGEDRIVKRIFKEKAGLGNALIPGNQPIKPSEKEVEDNPRARSAKVRVIEKL